MSRRFDAFAVPSRVEVAAQRELPLLAYDESGVTVRHVDVSAAWVDEVADALLAAREPLAARPAVEIAKTLGSVGGRFLDDSDPLRAEALDLLPATSRLSAEMAVAVLDGMAVDWTEERLLALVRAELDDERLLDGFGAARGRSGEAMAVGPRLCVQIVAGSVPGVGVSALLRSLLLKGPTLLKPGRGDVVLPVLFARALREADPALADALAVVYWPGGPRGPEGAALARADVVTAYGSDETVAELRDRTPVTSRFVAYHHRVSVGVVGRAALTADQVALTGARVAEAVAMFDRRGCVSPQVVFVEGGAASFAEALAAELGRLEERLPSGPLEPSEASELQQLRGTAELMAASGTGGVFHGSRVPWTVLVEPAGTSLGGCAGRTVSVREVGDVGDLAGALEPLGPHLQTVGVTGLEGRVEELARALGRLGASRIVPFGSVPFPPPWWHHDGRGPLLDLVRWVDLERE